MRKIVKCEAHASCFFKWFLNNLPIDELVILKGENYGREQAVALFSCRDS